MPFQLPFRLIFARHGETDWNAEGRLQGQQDTPMNGRGRAQAAAAGHAVAGLFAGEPARLAGLACVASPLHRTRMTMELIRESMGFSRMAYAIDPRLIEISFGRWQGLTWNDVKRADPAGAAGREADKWNYVPPGGESYAMLAKRLWPWLESLDRETLAVSHAGVARALMVMIGGGDLQEAVVTPIVQGRVLLFESGSYGWV